MKHKIQSSGKSLISVLAGLFLLAISNISVTADTISIDISSYFNNDGCSSDAAPAQGNFDGGGYSFPAETPYVEGNMPTSNSDFSSEQQTLFHMGNTTGTNNNNILCQGQNITLGGGLYNKIYILFSSVGDTDGQVTFRFAGGYTQTETLYATDWVYMPDGPGTAVAWRCDHRHSPTGNDALWTFLTEQSFNINYPYSALESIDLPSGSGIHIFAVSGSTSVSTGSFYTFDNFDSHTWIDSNEPTFKRGTYSYTPKHKTQGTNAWQVTSPLEEIPPEGDINRNRVEFTLTRWLPQPEDWSGYDFVNVDVYMEENPTELAEVYLTLYNAQGASMVVPPSERTDLNGIGQRGLILGWRLFQWENYQMTWPLKGNVHVISAIPDEILKNIVKVSISPTRYNDGEFGPAMTQINFHFDNIRLGGKDPWDTFDGPAYDWHESGDSGTTAGITHNNSYNNSAGSLFLAWNYAGTANYAEAATTNLAPQNWSNYTHIKAKVKCSNVNTPIAIFLWDGDAGKETVAKTVQTANTWETIYWELPQDDAQFSKANVTVVKVVAKNIDVNQTGSIYVDNLETGAQLPSPYALVASPGALENYLSWKNPPNSNFISTMIRYRTDTYPTSPTDGTLVCNKTNSPDTEDNFVHTGLTSGQTYYYTAFAYDGVNYSLITTSSQAVASQDIIRVSGSGYETGFSKENGAILYIKDKNSGKTISRGSDQKSLWNIIFFDEATLPSLSAAEFSAGSATKNFSYTENPLKLTYNYNEGGKILTLDITVTPSATDYFDLKAQLTNNMGAPIRTVSLPNKITFDKTKANQVILPIQEGLVLLRNFFLENRSTYLTRPPLFADCLALDSEDGQLAIYMIQDSFYQANIIPNHDPSVPAFQPNNLAIGTIKDLGYFNFDMVTYIPHGESWTSVTSRFKIGNDFRQIAAAYRQDNEFDNTTKYPTLQQKLNNFGLFDYLAKSPILAIEVYKTVEWLKTPQGQTWKTIVDSWLPNLPKPSVVHLTHWQYGRDWYSNPLENHMLEDDHPDCLPIWWDRYGPENEFLDLLNKIETGGFISMPFTNWTVWNKVVPGTQDLPPLSQTPTATRKLRGETYPFKEYRGYMVKPWHQDVINRDLEMIDTYTNTYPQDMLFVDMTGERYWRYVLMDDNQTASACAYTQATVDEDLRMSAYKPLFTEGVFDRIANSVTGYCQTSKQKFWNDILDHLGKEYEDWIPYPFAADVIHRNVAFYQHDLNLEVWPAESTSLFTYYTTFGYNYLVDLTKHYGEDEYWIDTCDAFQKVVCSRTFGQPLVDYQALSADKKRIRTIWGDGSNNITITANFDDINTYAVDNHIIAREGFLAATANGDVEAGIFEGTFNGAALSSGVHWITVEKIGNAITIRQPQGEDTSLTVDRPTEWVNDNEIYLLKVFKNGTEVLGNLSSITANSLVFDYNKADPSSGYAISKYKIYGNQTSSTKPPFFTSLPQARSISPTSERITWGTDETANSVVEYGLTTNYGSTVSDANYVLNHEIILTGLTESQTYHYRVKSTDPEGYTAISGDYTFVAGGVVWREHFDPAKTTWSNQGVTLTDEPGTTATLTESDPVNDYGKLESEIITVDLNTYPKLLVTSTAVDPNCSYSIQIVEQGGAYASKNVIVGVTQPSTDIVNIATEMGWSGVKSFRIGVWVSGEGKKIVLDLIEIGEGDSDAPTITLGPSASAGDIQATVIWTTNEASNSVVEYGLTTSYGSIVSDDTFVTNHSVQLTGLTPSTLYHYRVKSTDMFNNTVASDDFTFTTLPVGTGWQEHFDPAKPTWTQQGVTLNDIAGTTAILTESDPVNDYGKLESEIITLDVSQYPKILVTSTAIDAGSSYSIQIIEEGGAYSSENVIEGITQLGTEIANIATEMGWTGVKSFKIGVWVAGEGKSVTLDLIKIESDTQAPAITSGPSASPADIQATIMWSTNERSNSLVEYGLTTSYGSTISDATFTKDHSLQLTNLTPNTLYHYRVKSTDLFGNTVTSPDYIFTTLPVGTGWQEHFDPIKPTWDQPTATWNDIAGTTAILTENNPSADYGKVESEIITLDLNTYPKLLVTSTAVDAGSSYTVQIQEEGGAWADKNVIVGVTQPSTDYVNIATEMGWSGVKSFKIGIWVAGEAKTATFDLIKIESDTQAPTITQGPSASAGDTQATIIWSTDEKANSVVEYGLTTSYGSTVTDAVSVINHSVQLTGLTSNTLYHYRVKSTDMFGNIVVSSDYTFTTLVTGTGWQEHFDPAKPTWSEQGVTLNDEPGTTATLTESDPVNDYGKLESEVITLDVSAYPKLLVTSTAVDAGASYTIQIQEEGGAWANKNVIVGVTQPGSYIADIATEMGWSGVKSFKIGIWIAGEGKSAVFDLIRIGSAYSTNNWEEHFNPMKPTWNEVDITLIDNPDSTATLTESGAAYYGKIESEVISLDVGQASKLTFDVTGIDTDASISVGIQEEGGAYAYQNILEGINSPGVYWANFASVMGWSGIKSFKIVVWLIGESKSATLDRIAISAPDVTNPSIISGPSATEITSNSATINWRTNALCNATVEYGTTTSYGSTQSISDFTLSHSITLSGLSSNTLYHYRVKSTDQFGREVVSADYTFTTLPLDAGWQEDFKPMKTTWRDQNTNPGFNCTITDNGNETGTVEVVSGTYGKVLTEIMNIDVSTYPILKIVSTAVDNNTAWGVAIQAENDSQSGYNRFATPITDEGAPGTGVINIAQVTGWSGVHTFSIEIWVSGGLNKKATFSLLALKKDTTVGWAEYVNSLKTSWRNDTNPSSACSITDEGRGEAKVTVGATNTQNWGLVRSEVITLDTNIYPSVQVRVDAQDLSSSYKIGIQEEEGGYASNFSAAFPYDSRGTQTIDINALMNGLWTVTSNGSVHKFSITLIQEGVPGKSTTYSAIAVKKAIDVTPSDLQITIQYLNPFFYTPEGYPGYYIGQPMSYALKVKNNGTQTINDLKITSTQEYYESGTTDRWWYPYPRYVSYTKGEPLPGDSTQIWSDGIYLTPGQEITLQETYLIPLATCDGLDQTHVTIHHGGQQVFDNPETGIWCPPPYN